MVLDFQNSTILGALPPWSTTSERTSGTAWHRHGTARYGREQHGTAMYSFTLTRLSSFLLSFRFMPSIKSLSVACAAMSAATMYHYQWGIATMVDQKAGYWYYLHFVEKDTEFKFSSQENTMLAISSLALLFSIIEMILAFASAKSCGDTGYEPHQDNQVHIVTDRTKGYL